MSRTRSGGYPRKLATILVGYPLFGGGGGGGGLPLFRVSILILCALWLTCRKGTWLCTVKGSR